MAAEATFTVPEALERFSITLSTFLEQNSQYHGLAIGAMVFHKDHLLLVQRSMTDSFPGAWEVPGGACDMEDPTILHAAARELMEETSLRATRFVRVVGNGITFATKSDSVWFKYFFEVEVEQKHDATNDDAQKNRSPTFAHFHITLDPKEHQDFCWATRQDIEANMVDGKPLTFVSQEQKRDLLLGFERSTVN